MIHQYRPNFSWSELLSVLRSGAGRSELEASLAARVGARYGIAFAYGRSGMIAVYKSLGLSQEEVIMPALTCVVVADATVVSGNRPVFVDIDLTDYNMDISAIKAALTSQTRAIVATHMYGYPADVEAIRAAAGDDRIVIVEDCALLGPIRPARGATWLRGDVGIFSFGPGKHLYAMGGGVAVTNSADLYAKIQAYRDKEMNCLPWKVWAKRLARMLTGYMMLNAPMFEMWNRVNRVDVMQQVHKKLDLNPYVMPGDYATILAGIQARVGLSQLRKFDSVLSRHRVLAEFYDRELRDVPGITPAPIIAGATYSHYTPRVERRDEIAFFSRMRARGVEVGRAFSPAVPSLTSFRPYAKGEYPRAEQAARELVNLPHYAGLSETSAQLIAESARCSLQEALI